jgi:hypothetical protein
MTTDDAKNAASSAHAVHAFLAIFALLLVITAAPEIADDDDCRRLPVIPADCPSANEYRPQAVFALVIACITLVDVFVTCVLMRGAPCGALLDQLYAFTRFVLWTIAASWCSFTGPVGDQTRTRNPLAPGKPCTPGLNHASDSSRCSETATSRGGEASSAQCCSC